jgi:hypothetical protein
MSTWLIILLVVVALWVLASMKTSRPDGVLVGKVHPYRKLLGYIMPTRNEAVVYFDDYVNAEPMLRYLKETKDTLAADVTHVFVAAFFRAIKTVPRMNQFVVGRRLYRRKGQFITFSMKRKMMDRKAKLSAVKAELTEGMTFKDLCEFINGQVVVERSGKKTYSDKELDLLKWIPRPALRFVVGLLRVLDYYNLVPGFFIRGDAMYTSVFCANLGSLKMRAGYHHLFEWGTAPLFIMAGAIEDRAVVRDGEVVVQPTLHIRFSYDERIDDGLTASDGINWARTVMEDPWQYLGCTKADGSDAVAMDVPMGEPRSADKPTFG